MAEASYPSSQSAMMSAAMDAEAAARADALQREKRLQEKREKRRMLMEKEAIGLARNKQVCQGGRGYGCMRSARPQKDRHPVSRL